MTPQYAQVALPLPLGEAWTYRIPDLMADRVVPGARVVVPVRQRELIGVVVALADTPAVAGVRDILGAPDPEPALPPELLRTASWMARYYGAPLGLALRAALPSGLWGASRVVLHARGRHPGGGLAGQLHRWLRERDGGAPMDAARRAFRKPLWEVVDRLMRVGAVETEVIPAETEPPPATRRYLAVSGDVLPLLERERLFARAPMQRSVYEALEARGGTGEVTEIRAATGASDAVVRALVARGVVRVEVVPVPRDPFADEAGTPPPVGGPSPAQQDAIAMLAGMPPGAEGVLFGVTGSGKTLVYLELIRQVLGDGGGAILLVPEIALTPQAVGRVRGAFGPQVAVLHSALSEGERVDAWRAIRRGEKRVVVGARSAVFAPLPALGLVVLDEEHDASYKNGEAPRYHAGTVAAVRVRLGGGRLVRGSATPLLETLERVRGGVVMARFPARVGGRPLPAVERIDLRREPLVPGVGTLAWSERLDQAIGDTLGRREQVLLLLNRRGFAAFLQCPACGAVAGCPNCSISLTVHQGPHRLRCHYCDYQASPPERCAACDGTMHRARGVGTQQLERVVTERFPAARVARMDRDTTGGRWSHHRILEAVARHEVDILLGTQMIAKGIDFPRVTLVGVVDGDTALHLPDFRAAERTFQLLGQVAGRAGRGPLGGRVLVQTRAPDHHALVAAAHHDVEGFAEAERGLRAAPAYPPWTALLNVVVSGEDEVAVPRYAVGLAEALQRLLDRRAPSVLLLGPAPCPIGRINTRWRWHLLLKGPDEALGQVVRRVAGRWPASAGIRVALDRDPVSLL